MFIFITFGIIGNFHPALVHLPIGILFLACILQLFAFWKKENWLRVIRLTVLLGAISIVLSAITGLVLSDNGDYEGELLEWHKWMGIGLFIVSAAWYAVLMKSTRQKAHLALAGFTFLIMVITGHLGGTLTHGEGFLLSGLDDEEETEVKIITNVQEARVYDDLVQPLLKSRCYSCHGKSKQKGDFRMDNPEFLIKGGEDGKTMIPGNAKESEMIRRLLLPASDDDHMPPKPKKQLSEKEIQLLYWWIENGHPFDKTVKDIPQDKKQLNLLESFQNAESQNLAPEIPTDPVEPADAALVRKLQDKRILVLPAGSASNYLQVSFIGTTGILEDDILALTKLSKQLVYLKLSGQPITDKHLLELSKCTNLIRLHLDNTLITDSGLTYIAQLKKLRFLNLVKTNVTDIGIRKLKELPELKSLYLFDTKVNKSFYHELATLMPHVRIDTGGYSVPTLPQDTSVKK